MDAYSSPIPFKHVWKVSEKDLKKLKNNDDEICSNIEALEGFPNIKYKIEFVRDTKSDKSGKEASIIWTYLCLLNMEEDFKVWGSHVFYIKSAGITGYFSGKYSTENYGWGGCICFSNDLINPEKKVVVNGELILEIKGMFFTKSEKYIEKSFGSLCERLYNDEDDLDFVIIAGKEDEEKTEIEVHKLVLSMRSPVFKRMLKTDMKEKKEGKVEITDFDAETVQTAVDFCYDQEIFEELYGWNKYVNLHQFADKYDIADLKEEIELLSVKWITFENVCEVANALVDSNSPRLQDLCFRFMLMSIREGIPIKDMELLNADIAKDLLTKSTPLEYC